MNRWCCDGRPCLSQRGTGVPWRRWNGEERLLARRTQDLESSFDLDKAPLFRLTLLRTRDRVWDFIRTWLEGYVEPRTEVEEELAEIYGELLGVAQVGAYDSFFDLGGHSLLATRAVARIRDAFEIDLPLRDIFEASTVARLAMVVEEHIIAELEGLSEEEAALLAEES